MPDLQWKPARFAEVLPCTLYLTKMGEFDTKSV